MNNEGQGGKGVICRYKPEDEYSAIDWITHITENKCLSSPIMTILLSPSDRHTEVNNFPSDPAEFWYINSR